MTWGIRGVFFSLICALATGFILTPDFFGILELIGIAALIACIVLPIPNEESLLSRFRSVLFFGGMGLFFVSTFLRDPLNLGIAFVTWITVISSYTTLSGSFLGLSGTLNRIQLGLILYLISLLGISIGYLGSIYFS